MSADSLPINGTDHIELYVGNAKQSSLFYQHCFGFELVAYAGPETGVRDKASYVLKQDKIRLVLTSALTSESEIAKHVNRHGDGVKVLALWVDDARHSFEETLSRGAEMAEAPKTLNELCDRVQAIWVKMPTTFLHTLYESMPSRLEEVIKNKGGNTKY